MFFCLNLWRIKSDRKFLSMEPRFFDRSLVVFKEVGV